LAALIDWPEIERTFAEPFTFGRGRPALPSCLIVGLLYLQRTFDASNEAVVNTWVGKMDGRLARNPLKGALGDALHAVMCGAGHNLRLILTALRLYCARFGLFARHCLPLHTITDWPAAER